MVLTIPTLAFAWVARLISLKTSAVVLLAVRMLTVAEGGLLNL